MNVALVLADVLTNSRIGDVSNSGILASSSFLVINSSYVALTASVFIRNVVLSLRAARTLLSGDIEESVRLLTSNAFVVI